MALSKVSTNQIDTAATPTVAEATVTGDLTVDTNTLHVDAANNRVGIGTASPATVLHVSGGVMLDGITVIGREQTTYDSAGAEVLIDASASTPPLICHVGGTERFRITSDGNVSIADGNLILASGHGIDFSATSDGSGTTTSELLNDFELGSFTPVLQCTTTNPTSITYATQFGRYVKVGGMCHVNIRVAINAVTLGSASGEVEITGLPFANSNGEFEALAVGYSSGWSSLGPRGALVRPAATSLFLYGGASSSAFSSLSGVLTASNISTTFNDVIISGAYTVA